MADQLPVISAAPRTAAGGRLEPDAISVAQDTLIGLATVGPSVSVGLTLAALAATAAYGGAVVLILTALPMLIIANAYRRLNLWNANCGASFEWVGRAINPYLGFMAGWLMAAGTLIGTLSPVVVLGPSVLAVFGAPTTSTWPNLGIATTIALVMLAIAVAGIRLTARTQVAIGVAEYAILITLAVWGLAAVLGHRAGTFPVSLSWFSLGGIGGRSSLSGGFLLAVFMYSGWDGTLYVNEEVKHRRVNPGRAAVIAVAVSAVLFTLSQVGLQGVVSPRRLQAHAASGLVYIGQVLGGSAGARAAAVALALSVIAATGTGIVLTARILYGMASHRVLPPVLADVSRRFATPVAASVLSGAVLIMLTWCYLLSTSVQNAFTDVIDITGLLYASFYILTALAAVTYYRRRIFARPWAALTLGILPLSAAAFLGWVIVRSVQAAPAAQNWSLAGVTGAGLVVMLAARIGLRSPFFGIARESDTSRH
ncbi:MAG: APC family permease [Streptosporangiaceae bacterium]